MRSNPLNMARRPFLISFTALASEFRPAGSKGNWLSTPNCRTRCGQILPIHQQATQQSSTEHLLGGLPALVSPELEQAEQEELQCCQGLQGQRVLLGAGCVPDGLHAQQLLHTARPQCLELQQRCTVEH